MVDCNFCRNANTCDELSHNNDLSYMSCGEVQHPVRMLFRTGDNRKTVLLVEKYIGNEWWALVAALTPSYCPFCGRELIENKRKD